MPSEREIRKLYVNGRTICIEFFFCLLKIIQRSQDAQPLPKVAILGLGGYPSTSVLAGLLPAKIANMYIFALLATTSMTLQRHGEAVLL